MLLGRSDGSFKMPLSATPSLDQGGCALRICARETESGELDDASTIVEPEHLTVVLH
jgi:hypothetical protein